MKKISLILLTASLLLSCRHIKAQHVSEYGHINVQPIAKEYFDRFTSLMEAHSIPVDYTKVTNVEVIPLLNNICGIYSPHSKGVFLNYYMYIPKIATKEEKNDLIFLVLAHEMGHSQGWEHIGKEAIGLMNPSNKFDYGIVKGSIGVDQYVINTFKAHLCK